MRLRTVWPAVALTAALLTGCSSGTPAEAPAQPSAATPASTPTATATPTPSVLAVTETVPDGTWNVTEEVAGVGGAAKSWWKPVPKKGDVRTDSTPWTFSSTCTATECSGKITRESDQAEKLPPREFTWDGKSLKITRDVQRGSDQCYSDDGSPNGDKWSWERSWTYDTQVETDAQGRAVKLLTKVKIAMRDTTTSSVSCGTKLKPAHHVLVGTSTPA